eukprot:4597135-Pleurochrysis_carterae.AAC.1
MGFPGWLGGCTRCSPQHPGARQTVPPPSSPVHSAHALSASLEDPLRSEMGETKSYPSTIAGISIVRAVVKVHAV